MKIRNGFVSNSSSSSFIINKRYLSPMQIEQIYGHFAEIQKDPELYSEVYPVSVVINDETVTGYWVNDIWSISQNDDYICGYTSMDNFDMEEYLKIIGVNLNKVYFMEREYCSIDPDDLDDEIKKIID